MKQVVHDARTGALDVVEVSIPVLRPGGVVAQTAYSVVSVGTERQSIGLARKSLIGKALSRPDLTRQVLQKAQAEGISEAFRQAKARLDRPIALGYSSAGVVVEVGPGVDGLHVGDRIACSGLGFASHAEFVFVTQNMLAPVPEGVDLEEAAFAGVGAIALHGIRTGDVELGSRVVVIGLGLLGLIAVQALRAAGCHVFGTDLIPERVRLAQDLGAEGGAAIGEDVPGAVRAFTRGQGADAVLITASAPSDGPLVLAADVCRDRAKIVALGMIRLNAPRRAFYERELQLIVPRSSGPGVYDPRYETKGVDYPIAYARWTHRRNVEEFLTLVRDRRVDVRPLITHRAPIEDAVRAYDTMMKERDIIGLVFTYPGAVAPTRPARIPVSLPASARPAPRLDRVGVGLIGAGLFATGTLLPILRRMPDVRLRGVVTASGLTGRVQGERFGFEYASTEVSAILEDDQVDAVVIATRHGLHAQFASEALRRGKAVFVEKPPAISADDLRILTETWQESPGRLMVGYNRRFAPLTREAGRRLDARPGAALVHCRVNVGGLPAGTWLLDPDEGGGIVIGEVGHFLDLFQFLCHSVPKTVQAGALPGEGPVTDFTTTIVMADGSVATLLYTAQGDRSIARERVEIFKGGLACVLDDFRSLVVAEGGRRQTIRRRGVDRGHRDELRDFITAVRQGSPMPVQFEEYVATSRATFAILDALATGREATLA